MWFGEKSTSIALAIFVVLISYINVIITKDISVFFCNPLMHLNIEHKKALYAKHVTNSTYSAETIQ